MSAVAGAAAGIVLPAVGSPSNYRQSGSIRTLPSGTVRYGRNSSFFAGGGKIAGREDGVSSSGRVWASVVVRTIRIGNRLQSKSNAGPDVLPSLNPNEAEKSAPRVASEQSLEAPSPYPEGNGDEDVDLDVTGAAVGYEENTENDDSFRAMEERLAAVAAQENKTTKEQVESLGEDLSIPSMDDIIATAAQEGIKLQVMTFGPTFQIIVTDLNETHVYGKADGWIKWWWPKGKILHLESVKLERGLSKQVGNVGGAGFFVGAATLRHGLDQGCQTAELLAIYDDDVTHSKLVRYYSRFGFKIRYVVDEGELKHFPDRVVWGGVGTRMDADCEELLRRWCAVLKPKAKSGSRTK